jgi:hypothetical protein
LNVPLSGGSQNDAPACGVVTHVAVAAAVAATATGSPRRDIVR